MTHERVAEGVYRLGSPAVNWYLVADGERYTAIDAGIPTDWDGLVAALGALGGSLNQLAAVVVTHAHIDHIGFAERARKEAGARVYVHESDADNLRSPLAMAASERSPLLYAARYGATRELIAAMLKSRAPQSKPIRQLITYKDGDTLSDVPGAPRVIHTPGHTWGHCVLHMPDRGVLFAGDAFVTRNPYTGRMGPEIVSRAATANSAQALRSLDRLKDIDVEVALTGHGEPWRGGLPEAVRHAQTAGPS